MSNTIWQNQPFGTNMFNEQINVLRLTTVGSDLDSTGIKWSLLLEIRPQVWARPVCWGSVPHPLAYRHPRVGQFSAAPRNHTHMTICPNRKVFLSFFFLKICLFIVQRRGKKECTSEWGGGAEGETPRWVQNPTRCSVSDPRGHDLSQNQEFHTWATQELPQTEKP